MSPLKSKSSLDYGPIAHSIMINDYILEKKKLTKARAYRKLRETIFV
jgi:hypothetical protein